jgi:hypothetical protein
LITGRGKKQRAHFLVDLHGVGEGLRHLVAQQLAGALAQTVNGDTSRALAQAELLSFDHQPITFCSVLRVRRSFRV